MFELSLRLHLIRFTFLHFQICSLFQYSNTLPGCKRERYGAKVSLFNNLITISGVLIIISGVLVFISVL